MIDVIVCSRLFKGTDGIWQKRLSFGVHNIALAVNAHCGKALLILYEV